MKEKGWKITAIVLMVLFVLETMLLIWAFNVGTEAIGNESECAYNICEGYDAYQYDDYSKVCYCFEGKEITHQKYIG